jgi:hypothetical protein
MCGACGLLHGGSDWADGPEPARLGLAERQRRIRLLNRVLALRGLKLGEQGRQFVLRGPTGRTRIVRDLAHVWVAAQEIGGVAIDPLAEDFINRFGQEA